MFKFSLMRVRSKISYCAFRKRMPVAELMLRQIYSSYNALTNSGSIPRIAPYPKTTLQFFDELINDPNSFACVPELLELGRDPVLRARRA